MTETEWLTTDDVQAMLEFLANKAETRASGRDGPPLISDRKLRLFACACCRSCWHLLTDPRSRKAVEIAEKYADGLATNEERDLASAGACEAQAEAFLNETAHASDAAWATVGVANANKSALEVLRQLHPLQAMPTSLSNFASILRDMVGNPWKRWHRFGQSGNDACELKEDWLTPTVLSLAQAAYSGDWESLGPLSDALEESGCTDEAILRSLRGEVTCGRCAGSGRLEAAVWNLDDVDPTSQTATSRMASISCGECAGSGWVRRQTPCYRGLWSLDLLLGKE